MQVYKTRDTPRPLLQQTTYYPSTNLTVPAGIRRTLNAQPLFCHTRDDGLHDL
jgi:hypothetical protein